MTNEKLYVVITNDPNGVGGGSGGSKKKKDEEETSNPLSEYAKHEFMHLLKSTVQKTVSASVGQIGNLTGSYGLQEQAQNAYSIVEGTLTLGITAYVGWKVGMKVGNPVLGAVIGTSVGLIGSGISWKINATILSMEHAKQQHVVDLLKIRSGLDDTTNGGRTGS